MMGPVVMGLLRTLEPHSAFRAIVEAAIDRHPADGAVIARAAHDWVRRATVRGIDPMNLAPDDLAAIVRVRSTHTAARRRVGLCRLWDAIHSRPDGAPDPIEDLRGFDRAAATALRLTPDEHARVVGDAVRDLRDRSRRIGAARDLVAIGLLGTGRLDFPSIVSLRHGQIDDVGRLHVGMDVIPLRDDVLIPKRLLRLFLERDLGVLRPGDALLPATGFASIAAYQRRDRPDLLPLGLMNLRHSLSRRLHRAGLAVPQGRISYASMSWFIGCGTATFELPPDLAVEHARALAARP